MGHVPHNVSTAGFSKFGGRDTSGDISDWVFHAKAMLPMMAEAGPTVEVDRINLILKALEGQARAVVDGECTKTFTSGKILTYEMLLDALSLSFGHPDPEHAARMELNKLSQHNNEGVVSYLNRLDRLADCITGYCETFSSRH